MNFLVLFFVVLYELVVIIGVSWYINRKNAGKDVSSEDFSHASGGLGAWTLGATIALTSLGGGHILGLPSQVPFTGMGTFWFTVSSALMLVLVACYNGPWYRRYNVINTGTMFERMFDRKVAIFVAALNVGTMWGVITLEMQGLAAVLTSLTGWNIAMCCIVGGIIAILYVVFAGMQEVAKVNLINACVMYVGVIIALVFLCLHVAGLGGWTTVNDFYADRPWMMKFFSNGETWKTYIIGTLLGQLVFVPINQGGVQQAAAAKSTNTLKKAVMIIVPINCLFSIFMLIFGLTSNALGYPSHFMMLIDVLPMWVLIIVLAGFAAAMLSTIAVTSLCFTTVFVNSIYRPYYKPHMTDKENVKAVRVTLIVFMAIGIVFSTMLPAVNTSLVWLFAWMLAPFFCWVFGQHWKRSTKATWWTIIICSIANCIWSFTGIAEKLNLAGSTNAIIVTVFVIIIGVIFTAADKNAEPRLIDVYEKDKKAFRRGIRKMEAMEED